MQLIVEFATPDRDAFQAEFDADAEVRAQAGLTLLQMWRDADDPVRSLCLFAVNDRTRAEGWITRARAMHDLIESRFVKTA